MPACDYFSEIQSDITENMRAALIDWLVDVHRKFKLRDETLYITVNLIDRHLSRTKVLRCHLQLVGVSAMLIACKLEEIHPPKVSDFVFITENVGQSSPGLQPSRDPRSRKKHPSLRQLRPLLHECLGLLAEVPLHPKLQPDCPLTGTILHRRVFSKL